jgi:excisionase family DNA binding protein
MSSMVSISLAEAAKLTGLHKVSILRAIRKGKISAEKDEHGEWRIQPAELFRIYPPLPEQRNGNSAEQHYAASLKGALDAEISALKQVNQILRDQLDDMRGQRDKWEQAAQTALRQLAAPKPPARSWWWPMRRAA